MDYRRSCGTVDVLVALLELIYVYVYVGVLSRFSHTRLFATPWTVACQAPLSTGFPRQEYWSGLPFPSPGDLSDPGMEPMSPALAGKFFTSESPGKPLVIILVSRLVCLQQIHLNKKHILKAKTLKEMCYLSAEFFTGLSQGNTGESP